MTRIVRHRGGRRRTALLAALLGLTLAGSAAAGDLLSPSRSDLRHKAPYNSAIPFDRNINNYVLLALDFMQLKGGNGSVIRGGNVGVNASGGGRRNERLSMCTGSSDGNRIQMDEGTQVVADTADIARACTLWDVKLGYCCNNSDPLAHTLTFGTWYPFGRPKPLFRPFGQDGNAAQATDELPPLPNDISCDLGVPKRAYEDTSIPVPPAGTNTGGDVTIEGTVTLSSGKYTFCDLTVNRNATLKMQPGTIVRVAGNFRIPKGHYGEPSSINSKLIVKGDTVGFGANSVVYMQLWAPNANVGLGRGTELFGRFWAREMHSDFGMSVNPCPSGICLPGPTTSTSVPSTSVPPTTVPPTTVPPTTVPPTTVPPTTVPPTTVPPTTAPPTTAPPTTTPPTTTEDTLPPS